MDFRYFKDPHTPWTGWAKSGGPCHYCGKRASGYHTELGEEGAVFICENCIRDGAALRAADTLNSIDGLGLQEQLASANPDWSADDAYDAGEEPTELLEHHHPQLHAGPDFFWPAHCGDYMRFDGAIGAERFSSLLRGGESNSPSAPERSGDSLFLDRSPAQAPQDPSQLVADADALTSLEAATEGRSIYEFRCVACGQLRLYRQVPPAVAIAAEIPEPNSERREIDGNGGDPTLGQPDRADPDRPSYRYLRNPTGPRTTWTPTPAECAVCGTHASGYAAPFSGGFVGRTANVSFVCEHCLISGALERLGVRTNEGNHEEIEAQVRENAPSAPNRKRELLARVRELEHCTPPLVMPGDFLWPAHCGDFMRNDGLVGKRDVESMASATESRIADGPQAFFVEHAWPTWRPWAASDWDRVPVTNEDPWPGPESAESDICVYLFRCRSCSRPLFYWNWE